MSVRRSVLVAAAVSCGGAIEASNSGASASPSPPFQSTPFLWCTGAALYGTSTAQCLGESHKKVKVTEIFEVHGGAAGRHVDKSASRTKMSRIGTLSSPAAPPRIILGLGLEFLPASAHDKYNISYSTVVSPAKASGVVTPSPPVDNSPTNPEPTFRSRLRSGWTVDKVTLDF